MSQSVLSAPRPARPARLLVAILLLVLGTLAAGCSPAAPGNPTTAGLAPGTTVIDVRTPSEYAAGHLQGAVNIDIQGADFAAKIGALPKDGTYVLYCRSGARAGTALNQMKAAGFAHVTNAGGIDAASKSTGLAIVTS